MKALMSLLAVGLGFLQISTAEPLAAQATQELSLFHGVSPAEVTVGDTFEVVLRVAPPPGVAVEYLPFVTTDSLEALKPVRTTQTASGDTVAVYTLAAWYPNLPPIARAPVRLISAAGAQDVLVEVQLPAVRSVLPADEGEVTPKPPKGLIVPSLLGSLSWFWLLLIIGGLLAGGLALWLLAKRRADDADPVDPHSWALAQISIIASDASSSPSDLHDSYTRLSRVLRLFIARVTPEMGLDLSTTELLERLDALGESTASISVLAQVLGAADQVKFGPERNTSLGFDRVLADARSFVESYGETTRDVAATEAAA